jgi:SecD/SecF fusion protein
MVQNAGRKIVLIAVLLLTSLALLLVPDRPFNMGLDLQGGTRLTYSFDFDEIDVSAGEDPNEVVLQTISIIRDRIDPTGVLDAVVRQEGTDRIVIELPRLTGLTGQAAISTLAAALTVGVDEIQLDPSTANGFPAGGGVVRIGDEQIRYGARNGGVLQDCDRGFSRTDEVDHAVSSEIVLVSDDTIRNLIENLGQLSFQIQAGPSTFTGSGTDMATEESRLEAWWNANPGSPLIAFNSVAREDGGPLEGLAWYPMKVPAGAEEVPSEFDRKILLEEPRTEAETFRGDSLKRVFPSQDQLGYPAVGVEIQATRVGEFSDFTEKNQNRNMAILLNNEVASAPNINEQLGESFIIKGQFTSQEVNRLTTVLRSGSLRLKPVLEDEQVVGATLGEDYVRLGFFSGVLGLTIVLAFVVVYYRRLGIYAAVSLAASMLMLLGGLALLQATLTLPGIAGIILTVGMAVDANILIFDRIREEMDRGRNVKQAAKTGFEKALSAILDANITTLLTAIILYKVGTGPVRGFAVTLGIGIVTSVFAALMITRLLVYLTLEKGTKSFTIGKWLVKAKFDFLGKSKIAAALSTVLILGGLGLFFSMPAKDKYGIDFLGGAGMMFRTESPQTVDAMRDVIGAIPGEIGSSAEVKPVLDTETGDGTFTAFRTVFKVGGSGAGEASGDEERGFQSTIREALTEAGVLQKDKLEIVGLSPSEAGSQTLSAVLYFEDDHPVADIAETVAKAGIQNAVATSVTGRDGAYELVGDVALGRGSSEVRSAIEGAFLAAADSNRREFRLADSIPEVSVVGPQVVGDLKDKAILALLVSLFVVVLYIRVRFAEYSYGYAAVAALTHDVLITLGALSVANKLGLINGEISLPMIAAFLTIIGYSLNDTIVIFDRVRENLPRMKLPLEEVLNVSINQTLSRTVLTSITTLLAVVTLFAFNAGTGNVLESFSFAMIIGVVTGTYSTIFIANPVLLFLEGRAQRQRGSEDKSSGSGKKKQETAKALA